LSGPAITVTAIVPALAQFCVAWVKNPRWPAATAPAISHTITSSPMNRMMNLLVYGGRGPSSPVA